MRPKLLTLPTLSLPKIKPLTDPQKAKLLAFATGAIICAIIANLCAFAYFFD